MKDDLETTILIKVYRWSSAIADSPVLFNLLSDSHKKEIQQMYCKGRTIEIWDALKGDWVITTETPICDEECYRVKKTEEERRLCELEDEIQSLYLAIDERLEEYDKLL
jgi:hypothetical protein